MAVMELTENPNLILPAMLIIVVATLVTGVGFRQKSVFLSTLNTLGLQYPPNPATLHLQRAGVAAIMERSFARLNFVCPRAEVEAALLSKPRWIIVETGPGDVRCVLSAPDLQAFMKEKGHQLDDIPLLRIPAQRLDIANVDYRATIQEAQDAIQPAGVEALCIRRTSAPMIASVMGVITQDDIDNYREIIP